jgi:hypothetical protein
MFCRLREAAEGRPAAGGRRSTLSLWAVAQTDRPQPLDTWEALPWPEQVKGRRLDTEGGPRTRTRAKLQAERWSSVPLPVKIFIALVDALIEARVQDSAGAGSYAWLPIRDQVSFSACQVGPPVSC